MCRGFVQMTRTVPRRLITLQFSHIRFTLLRTFMTLHSRPLPANHAAAGSAAKRLDRRSALRHTAAPRPSVSTSAPSAVTATVCS